MKTEDRNKYSQNQAEIYCLEHPELENKYEIIKTFKDGFTSGRLYTLNQCGLEKLANLIAYFEDKSRWNLDDWCMLYHRRFNPITQRVYGNMFCAFPYLWPNDWSFGYPYKFDNSQHIQWKSRPDCDLLIALEDFFHMSDRDIHRLFGIKQDYTEISKYARLHLKSSLQDFINNAKEYMKEIGYEE